MAGKGIPPNIKNEVQQIITRFNKEVLQDPEYYYKPRFRGSCLYLERYDYGIVGPICRLKYEGAIDNWEFAIYKYSSERYDPDEWFFPGAEEVNGTVEGAMRAGLAAYS